MLTAGNAGLGISSVPFPTSIGASDVVGSDIFNTSSVTQRLTLASPTRTYTVNIPTAGTYYIGVFSGGSGASDSHTVVVNDPNLMEQVTARTYSDGQTNKVIYFSDTNQPVELPAIPANWTLVAPPQTLPDFIGFKVDLLGISIPNNNFQQLGIGLNSLYDSNGIWSQPNGQMIVPTGFLSLIHISEPTRPY